MRVTLAPVAGVVVRLAHSLLQTRNLVTYLVGAPAMGVCAWGESFQYRSVNSIRHGVLS